MRNNKGVALLEVLAALVILGSGGIALVELVGAGLRAERDARERERVLATEERVLAALTLLKRAEFDQRLGRRQLGEFVVDIQRPERTLYRIQVEDVVTVVYRRDSEEVSP